jgi:hypothetical protein
VILVHNREYVRDMMCWHCHTHTYMKRVSISRDRAGDGRSPSSKWEH